MNQFSGDAPLPPETTAVFASDATLGQVEYGLRHNILTPWETLAQSVAAIAPTTSPVLTIPLVFALAGNGTWVAYGLATVQVTLIALLIGALGRRSASPGSLYSYATDSLPPMVASIAAWALLLGYVATGASIGGGFVQYSNVLLKAFTGHVAPPFLLVLISILGAAAMAYRDVKLSTRAMLWLEGVSVTCIVLVLLLVLWKNGLHLDWPQMRLQGTSTSGIRLGLVLAIFSFVGFESATALGHEAKEPLRTIPRAVLQCALGGGVFFILAAYAEVLGFRHAGLALDKADAPLHVLAGQASVPVLGIVIDAGAMISMFACILACITAAARILLLMAHNRLVPNYFCRTHRRNDTPHLAVVLTTAVVLVPPLVLTALGYSGADIYGWLGSFAVYGFITIYGLTCVALPVQLKRQGALSLFLLVVAILGGVSMVMALAGTLYPVPAAPYSWLPYLYFVYLLITLVFFFRTQRRGRISHDQAGSF
ncbi:MAG TPA: APC family permease [Acidobacteriaceae bacterium]|nr:APC family permease [Acidobacteriaceae bacterium]